MKKFEIKIRVTCRLSSKLSDQPKNSSNPKFPTNICILMGAELESVWMNIKFCFPMLIHVQGIDHQVRTGIMKDFV